MRRRYYNHHHLFINKSTIQTMMPMMMMLMFKKMRHLQRATKIYPCVYGGDSISNSRGRFTSLPLKTTRWWQNFQGREEGVGCFFDKLAFLQVRSSSSARKSELTGSSRMLSSLFFSCSEAHLHPRESSLAFGLFQAHIFSAALLGTCLSAGKLRSDHWKEASYWSVSRARLSFLTIDNLLLGLVDLLPHLPEYLLLHHLQVPGAPVPVHHRVCFWGISRS